MAVKKVLVAVGMVCVLAPAALAMMRPAERSFADLAPQKVAQSILQQLYEAMSRNGGEARIPVRAGPDSQTRLPFRELARVINPGLSGLLDLRLGGDEEPLPGAATAVSYAALGDPSGQGTAETRRAAPEGAPSFAAGPRGTGGAAFAGRSFGGGGGGDGGAGNSDGPDSPVLQSVLDLEEGVEPNGATSGPASSGSVSVMPLPASVWMLLASVAGLAFIGYRRRSREI